MMNLKKFLLMVLFIMSGALGLMQYACAASEPAASSTSVPMSQIPYKHDNISVQSDLPRVAIGMTVCMLLLAGGLYFLRRRLGVKMPGSRNRLLRVVETQRLNPRSSLYVVEFGGNYHLLGQSEQGITCLVSSPTEIAILPPQEQQQ